MRNIWGGGAPKRFWELHSLLAQKGLDITLVGTPDASTYQRFDHKRFPDIEIIPIKCPRSFPDYIFYLKATKLIKKIKNKFDIFHDDFSPMAPYSFLWNTKAIATIHEFYSNIIRRYGIAGLGPFLNQKFYNIMKYKFFIVPSPSTAKDLRKLGINSVIIPNGVDTQLFKAKYDLKDKNKIVISMVSRFVPIKGHIFFLKVAKKLSMNYDNVIFILPSTGPLLLNMISLATNLNLQIRFPGFLKSEEEIANILQHSDIYINTSLQEGFGISICEAMSSELPIVAFDVQGVRDLVTPECGFLVPPGDVDNMVAKVKILIENEDIRREMGRHSRERVLNYFTWPKSANKLFEVYRNLY